MLFRCIHFSGSIHKCMKYCAYVVILISFLTIFTSNQYIFTLKKKVDIFLVIEIKDDYKFSLPMVYEDRSKVLTDQCNHSQVSLPDVEQYAPTELIKTYPWLNSALFPVQSKSLMYCAIPKVASKTLISLIMYVYIRDIINYVNNNRINTTRIQELVNIPMLVTQLQKV